MSHHNGRAFHFNTIECDHRTVQSKISHALKIHFFSILCTSEILQWAHIVLASNFLFGQSEPAHQISAHCSWVQVLALSRADSDSKTKSTLDGSLSYSCRQRWFPQTWFMCVSTFVTVPQMVRLNLVLFSIHNNIESKSNIWRFCSKLPKYHFLYVVVSNTSVLLCLMICRHTLPICNPVNVTDFTCMTPWKFFYTRPWSAFCPPARA